MAKQLPEHMTIEKWFFLLVTAVVLYLFWRVIQPFILVLLIAGVVAIILSPIDRKLRSWLKRPRFSATLLVLGTFFLIFIPLLITLFLMVTQASDLIKTSFDDTSWLEKLNPTTSPLIQALPVPVQKELMEIDLAQMGKSVASWAFENVGNLFSSTTKLILHAFIFFLSLYYILVNRDKLYKDVLALSPLEDGADEKLLKRIVNTIRSVVFGVMLVAIIQGFIAGLGMTIFGVPGSLIWGALTAVVGLVPLLGTSIVLIPAIAYLFFTGSTGAALGLLIWSLVFVSTIDNLVGPYLIGGKAHMNSFLVLISVLGGLASFGAVGSIAGPTILAALLGLLELYKSGILTKGKIVEKCEK